MKALKVATTLNNASLENEIRVNSLGQERDALTAKVVALEIRVNTLGQERDA